MKDEFPCGICPSDLHSSSFHDAPRPGAAVEWNLGRGCLCVIDCRGNDRPHGMLHDPPDLHARLHAAEARLAEIEKAAAFPRNTMIVEGENDEKRFKGRWVAVPDEDFDALRAALGRKPIERAAEAGCGNPDCVMKGPHGHVSGVGSPDEPSNRRALAEGEPKE